MQEFGCDVSNLVASYSYIRDVNPLKPDRGNIHKGINRLNIMGSGERKTNLTFSTTQSATSPARHREATYMRTSSGSENLRQVATWIAACQRHNVHHTSVQGSSSKSSEIVYSRRRASFITVGLRTASSAIQETIVISRSFVKSCKVIASVGSSPYPSTN